MRLGGVAFGILAFFYCARDVRLASGSDDFLDSARELLIGNFLAPEVNDITTEYLDLFVCKVEDSWNILNSQKRLKEQKKKFVMEGFPSSKGILVRTSGSENGRPAFKDEKLVMNFWIWQRWHTGMPSAVKIRTQLWDMMHIEGVGRESLQGRECLIYRYSVGREAENHLDLKRCAQTEGRLWFDADDKILVKVEGEHRAEIRLIGGMFTARSIPKGTRWGWQLQKIDGAWLPILWEEMRPGLTRFHKSWSQRVFSFSNYRSLTPKGE